MKSSLLLLLLWFAAVLPSQAVEGIDAAEPIVIYTHFSDTPAPSILENMKAELGAVLAPLRFDWHSLDEANGRDAVSELMVVAFEGVCRADALPAPHLVRGSLGWTNITEGEILPYAAVDCNKIRALIHFPLSVSSAPERSRLLGRSMARVLAHELYHYLTKSRRHAATGLAKAAYTSAELAAEHFCFTKTDLDLIVRSRSCGSTRASCASLARRSEQSVPGSSPAGPDSTPATRGSLTP